MCCDGNLGLERYKKKDDFLCKVKKAFDGEDNDICLADKCPGDMTCGECWNYEIQKYIKEKVQETLKVR